MKKIHRQPGPSTSGPPMSHAAVAPMPPSAPQSPSALFRSEPSVKVVEMIDYPFNVQPARYLRLSNSFASGQSITFPAAPSYLIFLPTR